MLRTFLPKISCCSASPRDDQWVKEPAERWICVSNSSHCKAGGANRTRLCGLNEVVPFSQIGLIFGGASR